MYQRHQDTFLLEEEYKATQLTQHLPNMTMQQVHLVIENGSPAELKILDEGLRSSLAGIGNVLRGGKESLQKTGTAIKGAASRAADTVKAVGAGGVAAAGQVGKNIGQMKQTGKEASEATQRKEQLINHLAQLEELYNAHKEITNDGRLKAPFERLTFQQLQQRLSATESVKKRAATQARSQGFFKGAGKAAGIAGQKAFEKSKQDRENPRLAGGGSGDPSRYAGPSTAPA